jgi:hypothetical protein
MKWIRHNKLLQQIWHLVENSFGGNECQYFFEICRDLSAALPNS